MNRFGAALSRDGTKLLTAGAPRDGSLLTIPTNVPIFFTDLTVGTTQQSTTLASQYNAVEPNLSAWYPGRSPLVLSADATHFVHLFNMIVGTTQPSATTAPALKEGDGCEASHAAFSDDGRLIVGVCDFKSARLWDTGGAQDASPSSFDLVSPPPTDDEALPAALAAGEPGTFLFVVAAAGLPLYRISAAGIATENINPLAADSPAVSAVALGGPAATIAGIALGDGRLQFRSTASPYAAIREVTTPAWAQQTTGLSISADGKFAAAELGGVNGSRVIVWNVNDGSMVLQAKDSLLIPGSAFTTHTELAAWLTDTDQVVQAVGFWSL